MREGHTSLTLAIPWHTREGAGAAWADFNPSLPLQKCGFAQDTEHSESDDCPAHGELGTFENDFLP